MTTVRVRVGKDGTRRWQVRYLGSDGREHAQTFHRKTDADRFVSTVETDKLRGDWVDPRLGNITLRAWWERVAATRVLKPKTTAGYTFPIQPPPGEALRTLRRELDLLDVA